MHNTRAKHPIEGNAENNSNPPSPAGNQKRIKNRQKHSPFSTGVTTKKGNKVLQKFKKIGRHSPFCSPQCMKHMFQCFVMSLSMGV
uniref:Uncharacterized protein n=1 Tax=Lutzomyia longipalpis TaxID=7200 RepID=A0A7G3B5F5_LUTLO